MKILSQKLEKSVLEMSIEVGVDEQQKYLERAAQELSKEKPLAGFRPGKVPYEIAQQRYGAMAILEKALHRIVEETYLEAIKNEHLETVGQPKIDIEKLAPGNPLVYSVKITLLPKVSIGDLSKIKIKRNKVEINQKKLDRTLEDLRRMQHTEAAVDREVQPEDKVIVDIDMYQDKVPVDGGATKSHQIYLKDEYYIPGLKEKLIGMKKNEIREFTLPFSKEHYNKNLAGKEIEFKVKLNGVFAITLPELNDEFAKALKFESLSQLKDQIGKNILDEEKDKSEQKAELEMIDEIIKVSRIDDIPELLLENEINKMAEELKSEVREQGLDFDEYLKKIKKTEDELRVGFIDPAAKRVKISLITHELAQERNIDVSDEEFDKEFKKIRELYKDNPEVLGYLDSPGYGDYLRTLLTNRKVIKGLKKELVK